MNVVTTKDIAIASNDNENNSVENISGLDDSITPSIKRGFYGLEDMMVRRQHLSIKKFVDKAVQVGNGWIGLHDFAGQTSFVIEEKDNRDVILDEYLKSCSDQSYHSEDASEDNANEFNENSKTNENESKSIQKESGNEPLSNSDMSIDYGHESYQGNENFIENLVNEKENQNHVHFSESCARVNSNTTGLI